MVGGVSNGEPDAEEDVEGTCRVGLCDDLSSRSELWRRTVGGSARNPSPTALELFDIFLIGIGSSPAAVRRELARSLSDRRRSLSATREAH